MAPSADSPFLWLLSTQPPISQWVEHDRKIKKTKKYTRWKRESEIGKKRSNKIKIRNVINGEEIAVVIVVVELDHLTGGG